MGERYLCRWTGNRIDHSVPPQKTRRLSGIAVSQVMLTSFLLILGSFFLGRFLGPMKSWMLLAGVFLFVSSFGIMVFTRNGSGQTQHWRGQDVTLRSESLATRLRRWFANRRAHR